MPINVSISRKAPLIPWCGMHGVTFLFSSTYCWHDWFLFLFWQFRYEKYHGCYGGDEEERKANYTDMVSAVLFLAFFLIEN
jgi:hypothetical protein